MSESGRNQIFAQRACASNLDMPKGPSLRLGLSQFTRCSSTPTRRFIHTSPSCLTTVALPLHDNLAVSGPSNNMISQTNPRELLKKRLIEQLAVLLTEKTPSNALVWGQYLELLHFVGAQDIPAGTHRSVLRHCVPPAAQLRVLAAQDLRAGHYLKSPHRHEIRLQTVIRNIKATGTPPALEDYHVILEQFAAVGHYIGAVHVYEELVTSDIHPQPKTYGLLLQSLAHRLTLATPTSCRPQLVWQIVRICRDILAEMSSRKIPFSAVNLDLAVRVLKETADEEGFAHLMRVGYGIDLGYPDRAPVEHLVRQEHVDFAKGLPYPQSFSTAALNTTIDMLGRFGDVSKLVQAFEVLTQPLPSQADHHFSKSFDDDDDDYGVSSPALTQLYQAPYAAPNTTTYNILLRHLSRSGHGPLARHYLQQAYRFDRVSDRAIRAEMINLPKEVPAPHFGVNRGTILPVFGLANRNKDMELMRWVGYIIRQTLRRKGNDIKYYSSIAAQLAKESSPLHQSAIQRSAPHAAISPNTALATPSGSKSHSPVNPSIAVFEVDLDGPLVSASPPAKKFDINLHLRILHRDHEELVSFYRKVSNVISRTTQRIKERLGRRVWAGKDLYLLSENRRRLISRQTWTNIVRFRQVDGREDRGPGIPFRIRGRQDLQHKESSFTSGRHRMSTSAFLGRVGYRRRST